MHKQPSESLASKYVSGFFDYGRKIPNKIIWPVQFAQRWLDIGQIRQITLDKLLRATVYRKRILNWGSWTLGPPQMGTGRGCHQIP